MEAGKKIQEMTYTQAKKELEEIVAALEAGELDVDALAEKVKRASMLITFCREKLTHTDKELSKILEEIG